MTGDDKVLLIRCHDLIEKANLTSKNQGLVDAVALLASQPGFKAFLQRPDMADKVFWPPRTRTELHAILFANLLYWLYNRDYEAGATLCWGNDPLNGTFTSEPKSVQAIWGAIKNYRLINILGAASLGKTYSPSAFFLLDWAMDPDWTLVRVMSTKEEHVKKNLFADMQRLYQASAIRLPGKADAESIATENGKKAGQGIFMIVIPRGSDASATIKGSKVKPRPMHPLFGSSSRTRLLIDEAQDVPENAFDEIPNLYTSMEEGDMEHAKIVMAANPKDIFSRYGQNCIPEQGWEEIQVLLSKINEWESTTGWHCIRLNALECENMTAQDGKTRYARFFTRTGYKMKLKAVGGDTNHPLIWSEVYGMFPPGGMMSTIIQKHWVDRSHKEWIFQTRTIPGAGEDPAFTGDSPAMTSCRAGLAVGWFDYNGVRHDLPEPAWKIQIDTVGTMARGDTQDLANESLDRVKLLGVKPEAFGIDRTGVGQGTHDIICRQWKRKVDNIPDDSPVAVVGIHFSEKASDLRICEEDTKLPSELYDGVRSEVWFACGKFFEYDVIGLSKGVPFSVIEQLVSRRGGKAPGKGSKMTVESKDDYKARHGGKSPDEADSFTICVQAIRTACRQLLPKAPETQMPKPKESQSFFDPEHPSMDMAPAFDLGFSSGLDDKSLSDPKD